MAKTTKTPFNLIDSLHARRDEVIAAHATTNDGIELKDFMNEVLWIFRINNITSQKAFDRQFPYLLGEKKVAHTNRFVCDRDRDKELADKYRGTAFMALV